MAVKKLTDKRLVDALNIHVAAVYPLGKVRDATHVIGATVPGVAAVSQVLLEGINIGRQSPLV